MSYINTGNYSVFHLAENTSSEQDSNLGREENGRPRRKSAMNSLYYHSSLHYSSYRLARHAATVSVCKPAVYFCWYLY